MKYQILEDNCYHSLSEQVNELIKSNHGTPIGGVFALVEEDRDGCPNYRFFQAILTR